MKKIFLFPLFSVILITSYNCTDKPAEEIPEAAKTELRQDAREFMESLRSVLVKEMQTNGLTAAVSVCSDTAQAMTASYGTNKEIYIKRVSFNNRNPVNYPDEFESDGLKKFEELKSSGRLDESAELFEVVETEEGKSIRYLKPIMIQAPCLNCHGPEENINADVMTIINEKYPNDKATGYEIDQLRGAVSVVKNL
jgi:hypothetical protein